MASLNERVLHENPTSPGFDEPDRTNYASSDTVAHRARDAVRAAMASARDARGQIPQSWQQNINAYFNIRARKSFKGRANVVDPEPFRVVETISARGEKAILAAKPWLKGFPGPGMPVHDQRQAEINEALLQHMLEVGSDGKRCLKSAVKSVAILGTVVMKCQWVNESVMRRIRDPLTGKLAKPSDSYVYRGVKWTPVDLEDFYVADPVGAETCDDQDFVIEKKVVQIQKLQAMERLGQLKNTNQIDRMDIYPRHYDDEGIKQERAALVGASYDVPDPAQSPVGKTELWMYEGPFDLYGDETEIECWIWMAGDVVVRVQENPYWHGRKSYVSAPCIRVPGNFYGLSPIQPILDLWAELNDLHNMGLDSAVLSLNPAIKVGAGAGIDFKRWMLSPGAFLPANDISQIEPFVIPPMVDVAHQSMGPLRQMMRETTSATDLLQAQGTGGIDKATIYTGAVTEANVRIATMYGNFADMMEDGGRLSWGLIQQYMDEEMNVRITGKNGFEWIPVRPEDVRFPMDFKAVGIQNIGSEVARNMGLERFLATFTPLALQGAVQLDFNHIAKTWATSLGLADPDSFIAADGPKPMNPKQENILVKQRQPIDVHPQDDHAAHVREHMAMMQEIQQSGEVDPVVMQMLQDHLREHEEMFKRVEAAKQAMAQLQAQQAMQQAGVEGGNGQAVPALGNQSQFGPNIGAAKEQGERLGGRLG